MKIIDTFKHSDECFVEYISDEYKNYISFNFIGNVIKIYSDLELLYDFNKVSENYQQHFDKVNYYLLVEFSGELIRKGCNGAGAINYLDAYRHFIDSFVKYFLKDYENFDYSKGNV